MALNTIFVIVVVLLASFAAAKYVPAGERCETRKCSGRNQVCGVYGTYGKQRRCYDLRKPGASCQKEFDLCDADRSECHSIGKNKRKICVIVRKIGQTCSRWYDACRGGRCRRNGPRGRKRCFQMRWYGQTCGKWYQLCYQGTKCRRLSNGIKRCGFVPRLLGQPCGQTFHRCQVGVCRVVRGRSMCVHRSLRAQPSRVRRRSAKKISRTRNTERRAQRLVRKSPVPRRRNRKKTANLRSLRPKPTALPIPPKPTALPIPTKPNALPVPSRMRAKKGASKGSRVLSNIKEPRAIRPHGKGRKLNAIKVKTIRPLGKRQQPDKSKKRSISPRRKGQQPVKANQRNVRPGGKGQQSRKSKQKTIRPRGKGQKVDKALQKTTRPRGKGQEPGKVKLRSIRPRGKGQQPDKAKQRIIRPRGKGQQREKAKQKTIRPLGKGATPFRPRKAKRPSCNLMCRPCYEPDVVCLRCIPMNSKKPCNPCAKGQDGLTGDQFCAKITKNKAYKCCNPWSPCMRRGGVLDIRTGYEFNPQTMICAKNCGWSCDMPQKSISEPPCTITTAIAFKPRPRDDDDEDADDDDENASILAVHLCESLHSTVF